MKGGMIAVLLVALVASPLAVLSRELQQGQTGTSCVADSSATLTITSGSGFAKGSSFCDAEADAANAIETIIVDYADSIYEDPETQCTVGSASVVVEDIASAYASAYSSASAEVAIEGTGEACAQGFAEGDAFATALVDILVQISIQVVTDKDEETGKKLEGFDEKNTSASGEAVGRAVSAVISNAWSSAVAAACTTGGFDRDFQESFAEEINDAVAFLYADVVVTVCESLDIDTEDLTEWQASNTDSTSFVTGEIMMDRRSTAEGDASTSGGTLDQCQGVASLCCRPANIDKDTCRCGSGCTATPFPGQPTNLPEGTDPVKVWETPDGACFCL